MLKLLTKNPLTHALAWIGIYVGSVNVLDALSESLESCDKSGLTRLIRLESTLSFKKQLNKTFRIKRN